MRWAMPIKKKIHLNSSLSVSFRKFTIMNLFLFFFVDFDFRSLQKKQRRRFLITFSCYPWNPVFLLNKTIKMWTHCQQYFGRHIIFNVEQIYATPVIIIFIKQQFVITLMESIFFFSHNFFIDFSCWKTWWYTYLYMTC